MIQFKLIRKSRDALIAIKTSRVSPLQ